MARTYTCAPSPVLAMSALHFAMHKVAHSVYRPLNKILYASESVFAHHSALPMCEVM